MLEAARAAQAFRGHKSPLDLAIENSNGEIADLIEFFEPPSRKVVAVRVLQLLLIINLLLNVCIVFDHRSNIIFLILCLWEIRCFVFFRVRSTGLGSWLGLVTFGLLLMALLLQVLFLLVDLEVAKHR